MATTHDFLKEFIDLAEKDIKQIIFNDSSIKLILKSIEQWIKVKQRLDKKLISQYKQIQKENIYQLGRETSKGKHIDLSSAGLKELTKKYSEQKRKIRNLHDIEEITEHFKKGYALIHYVREILTKQVITYSILYSDKRSSSEEVLLEAHLTMEQLLSGVSLTTSDTNIIEANTELTNAMNLSIRNTSIKKLVENAINNQQKKIEMISSELDKPELWDSLVKLTENKNFYSNAGQWYEAYSILRRREKYKSINIISEKTSALAESLITEAVANNDPGWQIGDIGLEQLKSVFNGAANLINISTIEKVLKQLKEALQYKNKLEMIDALQKIYTTGRSNFNNEIDVLAEREAIYNIEETVKKAFKT